MVTIENRANTIAINFGAYSSAFGADRLTIEKRCGNRVYLGPGASYIAVIFPDGDKVVLQAGSHLIFDAGGGQPFASMEALYLAICGFLES